MDIRLQRARPEEKEILNNLMEKYLYEFSQYDLIPFNENGLFDDPYLGEYFTDPARHPYLIYADGKLAGLALINKHAECPAPLDWAVAEFFIAYPYRRKGVGAYVMRELFKRYQGVWQIKYHPKNAGSEIFWKRIASEASGGTFETVRGNEDYCDGTPSQVLVFTVK